jgi:hypothetical protein
MRALLLTILFFGLNQCAFSQNLASFSQHGPVKFPSNPSVQTTGMGRVSQLVYHPTDSNILYAVSASGVCLNLLTKGIPGNLLQIFYRK